MHLFTCIKPGAYKPPKGAKYIICGTYKLLIRQTFTKVHPALPKYQYKKQRKTLMEILCTIQGTQYWNYKISLVKIYLIVTLQGIQQ